jgi:hypothetical protein
MYAQQQPGGTPTRGDSPREEGEEPVVCGGLRLDPPRLETSWQGPGEVMAEIASVTPSWRGVSYDMLRKRRAIQYPVPHADSEGTPFLFGPIPDARGRAI